MPIIKTIPRIDVDGLKYNFDSDNDLVSQVTTPLPLVWSLVIMGLDHRTIRIGRPTVKHRFEEPGYWAVLSHMLICLSVKYRW